MAPAAPLDSFNTLEPSTQQQVQHRSLGWRTDIITIVLSVLGSLLVALAACLVHACMKRRRASRRIGQVQEFLPTSMESEKKESYLKKDGLKVSAPALTTSTTTLTSMMSVSTSPSAPVNAHHRTLSAPIACATAGRTSRQTGRMDHGGIDCVSKTDRRASGRFQQISLIAEEPYIDSDDETALQNALSASGPARTRSKTVTSVTPATVSTLHHSVGRNHHHRSCASYSSRAPPMEEDIDEALQLSQDNDALPIAGSNGGSVLRFAEGESVTSNSGHNNNMSRSSGGGYSTSSNRYSVGMGFNDLPSRRFSTMSHFDPTRFSTISIMFDAKQQLGELSRPSSDDDGEHDDDNSSLSSGDDFDLLPPHQKPQNFESHTVLQLEEEEEVYPIQAHEGSRAPGVAASITHDLHQDSRVVFTKKMT
ncbi:hypothetical protein BGZ94_004463 [Podila epigama]|nr:hypothetical protein BGZ94_004463 [Podila epigama]